jgi:hypothetical protein
MIDGISPRQFHESERVADRLVRDQSAPSWWTLADAAGNEADIGTIIGRD